MVINTSLPLTNQPVPANFVDFLNMLHPCQHTCWFMVIWITQILIGLSVVRVLPSLMLKNFLAHYRISSCFNMLLHQLDSGMTNSVTPWIWSWPARNIWFIPYYFYPDLLLVITFASNLLSLVIPKWAINVYLDATFIKLTMICSGTCWVILIGMKV